MKYTYRTKGVCSSEITVTLNEGIVEDVEFLGGCNGNLKAISKLVKGMSVAQVADILEGTTCGRRDTSCSDQMVKALKAAQEAEALSHA